MALTPPPSAPPAAPTAPGAAPQRADPSTFRGLADSFVVWLVGFRTSIASLVTWLSGYITWAGTNVTELNALQTDVATKQATASSAASTASSAASSASADAAAAVAARNEVIATVPQTQLADYTALRAYAGVSTSVRVTGFSTSLGIAGDFTRDDADTTSADNGGTIIVTSGGKRWKRIFDGAVDLRWFGVMGADATVDTPAVQAAIDFLESRAGGVLGWCDAKLNAPITIQCSNLTIQPLAGCSVQQVANSFNTFRVYPTSLNTIWDGTGRPAGFANGIDGAPELLMYESNDAIRLRNIQFLGLNFQFTGVGAFGRFVDAFSVDDLVVRDCKVSTGGNGVNLFYCRNAKVDHNDITCLSASTFCAFLFKSYGVVEDNTLRNAFNAVDAKGCYPQAGKGVLEAFDAGYNFNHPVKMVRNRVIDASNAGLTSGYLDNSGADISATLTTGVTKKAWYGETWGVEYLDNTISHSGSPGVGTGGIVTNINSKYHKIRGNVMHRVGVCVFNSVGIEIDENTIIDPQASGTAAIVLQGGTIGASGRNATDCAVRRNRIIGGQVGQAAIRLRGADSTVVEANHCLDGSTGTISILVDSTASFATSTGNQILRNIVRKTAADFAHPVRATAGVTAGTVIDGNRGYGGWFNGNSLDSDGFADNHYKRGVVSADTPTSYVGSAGTCNVGQNFGDQNASTPEPGYASEMALNGTVGGGWRQAMRIGASSVWGATLGNLRVKTSKPTGDTDGAVLARKVAVPALVNSAGLPGDWAADNSNAYFYTGDGTTHTWRRVAVAAF